MVEGNGNGREGGVLPWFLGVGNLFICYKVIFLLYET